MTVAEPAPAFCPLCGKEADGTQPWAPYDSREHELLAYNHKLMRGTTAKTVSEAEAAWVELEDAGKAPAGRVGETLRLFKGK